MFLQKQFVFIFRLEFLLTTTGSIIKLMGERSINVAGLHLDALDAGEGKLMIHFLLERDRIGRTLDLFKKLPGVLGIDWMESKF